MEADKPSKISYETALTKLEAIVESMESGEIPLSDLLAKFEEGNKLLKVCEGRLQDAQMKIEALKRDKTGSSFTALETERGTS